MAVTLVAPDLAITPGGFQPQGVPSNGSSTSIDHIDVFVTTADGTPISFDDNYNMVATGGTKDRVVLSSTGASINLLLRPGTYDFEAKGENAADTLLAYRLLDDQTITQETSINLPLESLLGSVLIEPATPTTYVVPGQTLDLLITVHATDNTSLVPLADFAPTYTFLDSNSNVTGTNLGSSHLGVRVQADASGTLEEFSATVEVAGKVDNSGAVGLGNRSRTIVLPFSLQAGIASDTTAPSVSMDTVSLNVSVNGTITGTANDNLGITKLQVYEGPIMIGSSDSTEYADPSIEQVMFAGTNWSVPYTPTAAGNTTFTAVAFDATGNTSQAAQETVISNDSLFTYYRDADEDGHGDSGESVTTTDSSPPSGYTFDNTDCDDSNMNTYPGATDPSGDGVDQDCDGVDG